MVHQPPERTQQFTVQLTHDCADVSFTDTTLITETHCLQPAFS